MNYMWPQYQITTEILRRNQPYLKLSVRFCYKISSKNVSNNLLRYAALHYLQHTDVIFGSLILNKEVLFLHYIYQYLSENYLVLSILK
jgi:hypothetical protein